MLYVAGAFMLSPYTDLTFAYPSMHTNRLLDPMVSGKYLSAMRDLVIAASTSTAPLHTTTHSNQWTPKEPWLSPAHAHSLSDLAPLYVQCAKQEVMRDDAVQFVTKVQSDGGQAVSEVLSGVHAMYLFEYLPEYNQSIEHLTRWARKMLR